ncbi:Protein stoned-B [Mizuhopecten yessoensis]|uniref:Protein stoned-B n=1 Tax=Mizuhopecten yessoensis TaxID=6573 RepID=A0A210QAB6_MIZYE|nr:Protein stoned-B [Mizuhopecten yessoensis]
MYCVDSLESTAADNKDIGKQLSVTLTVSEKLWTFADSGYLQQGTVSPKSAQQPYQIFIPLLVNPSLAMSASFDESSNLVDTTSPTTNEDFSKLTVDHHAAYKSEPHEKSHKGFGFIKKHTHKDTFKDEFPDDVKEASVKVVVDKKSDDWQAFQQMQDRIKQNVVKTQTSLNKLSSDNSETSNGTNSNNEKHKKIDETFWSSFDDTSSLIPPSPHGVNKDKGKSSEQDSELNVTSFPNLKVTPTPSPRGTPCPPANSLRTSMENLMADDPVGSKNEVADLLGLTSDPTDTDQAPADSTYLMNQDLLGLDNILSSTGESQHGSSMCSSFDGSDMVFGTVPHSERSSQRSTPLGFDPWEDDQRIPMGTLSSTFVSSMVDEFLQLDTMKEVSQADLNPFDSSADKPAPKSNIIDSLDPFSAKKVKEKAPLPPTSVDVLPQPSTDILSQCSSEILPQTTQDFLHQSDTDTVPSSDTDFPAPLPIDFSQAFGGSVNLSDEAASSHFDAFGQLSENILPPSVVPSGVNSSADFLQAFDDTEDVGREIKEGFSHILPVEVYDNLAFGVADPSKDVPGDQPDNEEPQGEVPVTNNPFLTSDISEQPPVATDLFDDNFFETKGASQSQYSQDAFSNIWGNAPSDNISQGVNPFQEDFFSIDKIPDTTDFPGEAADNFATNTSNNPFLQDDSAAIFSTVSTTSNANPFLDDTVPAPKSELTDINSFLLGDAAKGNAPQTVKSPTLDDFDPFGMSAQKAEESQSDQAVPVDGASKDAFTAVATSVPPPALKPPPRPPRSPQPPRENPFNRDSPPEENFAEFEIRGGDDTPQEKDSNLESLPSFSTEDNTPEEELAALPPLEPFLPSTDQDVWSLMLRQPTKKKLTTNRFWKQIYVKLVKQSDGPILKVYQEKDDAESFTELILQPCYSISEVSLQQYDQYGKIYTVKVQYIFYRERVGLRAERMTPAFVKKPKATMILAHAPQVSEMLKFGSLDKEEITMFVREVENALMNMEARREKTLTYIKDEVCAEVWDEYKAELDKQGRIITQKARVRAFFLAFVTGMPTCELGLNDKRRRGKEVVGRHDIIPIKTEEWIRLDDVQFHCSVDVPEFEKTNNIKFHPLDACQFELLRYRVRLRENKELPLQLKVQQILKESKVEIRCDILVTGYHSFSKKHGQFPCEDIEIRFPIPEQWVYLFRYEKRFGYGAFKSATRKPGKIKGLERITMIAQGLLTPTLMETDVGVAKYEHLYKAVVWRISRLPERNEGAYKSHLFRMTLEFGPHDEIPESFESHAEVEFTMPSCTVSQSQVRSISVENPNPPDKWVRYIAKYQYRIEIDHINEVCKTSPDNGK